MSIPKRPFFYQPDEFFNFGFAGEHPIEFVSWIGECGPGELEPVHIIMVSVHWRFLNPCRQSTDITEQVLKYHREKYEDEIRAHYRACREKDWERGA